MRVMTVIVLIDNYDSFTYNLVHYVKELDRVEVYRNDKVTVHDLEQIKPTAILISPGPGTPDDAGVSLSAIHHFKGKVPILGVCLGHQAIAQVFGGRVIRAKEVIHGKTSLVYHDQQSIFTDLPTPFSAMRYHSLVVQQKSFPKELMVTARTKDGDIMALRHRRLPIEGVQFHPESILSEYGREIIRNFIQQAR